MAQYRIENGPSKFDVAIALFHAPTDGAEHHVVIFTLMDRGRVRAVMTAAELEDNAHDSFLIEGFLLTEETDWMENAGSFKGIFNFRTRTGTMETTRD